MLPDIECLPVNCPEKGLVVHCVGDRRLGWHQLKRYYIIGSGTDSGVCKDIKIS